MLFFCYKNVVFASVAEIRDYFYVRETRDQKIRPFTKLLVSGLGIEDYSILHRVIYLGNLSLWYRVTR